MFGNDFPISDYLNKENIIDAITIKRSGTWWSAVLLIKDPKDGHPFIALYKWQMTGKVWKVRNSYKIRQSQDLKKLIEILTQFGSSLSEHKSD